ncbi:MAG: PIN domain-containing protein [Treponema sp.]|nr:PIN domain-containing protein [Treponema sp.]
MVYAFASLKKILNIESTELTEQISMIAVNLRTKYKGLKALDSIHIASAIASGCDAFFTNDKQLKQISELHILYLSDL